MDGGVRFTTRNPAVVHRFARRDGEQVWEEVQPGNASAWPSITGGIFESGFSDAILQMWATFLAERAGALGEGFGCATPEEGNTMNDTTSRATRAWGLGAAALG